MQLKAREKDQHRLKNKLTHLEGKSLAAMQREGSSMVSMQSLSNKKLFPSASNDKFTVASSSRVKLPEVQKVVRGARLRQ